ncbi:(2Fe-2S)-binding protein [Frankia nepalensis]|uniref:(2Fe-2S)-binding protein n=1 Tax=Frankia nepalensis TaxID=1836974 RepID=UPI0019332820|nr:(2Fe-2S)-binding protein [Frankia nepalensis]MBL7511615.1 (2Fe-2S)-binding protein [Frankia nepalensis]
MAPAREPPGEDGTILEALAARFGPFFALTVLPTDDPAGWAPVADLAEPSTGALARRVDAVRAALAAGRGVAPGELEERVAVSITQLGLCARLVAPALGLTVLTGRPPALDLLGLYWRDQLGGPFPLALARPTAPDGPAPADPPPGGPLPGGWPTPDPGQLARGFVDGTLRPLVEPLVAATAARYPVSSRVLWGNTASAVAGAAKMIGLAAPELAPAAWRIVDALCAGPGPLAGAGARVAPARFRRRSCCLIYRLGPSGAVCEDCVLAGPPPPASTPSASPPPASPPPASAPPA